MPSLSEDSPFMKFQRAATEYERAQSAASSEIRDGLKIEATVNGRLILTTGGVHHHMSLPTAQWLFHALGDILGERHPGQAFESHS